MSIRQRASYLHCRITGHLGVLGKTTITLRTKIPTGIGLVVGIRPQNGPNQDPLACACLVHARADCDDLPTAVCALNARKRHGHTAPTGVVVCLRIKYRCCTLRLPLRRFRIPAHTGVDVGVVDGACTHTNQDLTSQGLGYRKIVPVLKALRPAKTGQYHALHCAWKLRRVCHGAWPMQQPLWLGAARSRARQTSAFQGLRAPMPRVVKAQQPMAQKSWPWARPCPH